MTKIELYLRSLLLLFRRAPRDQRARRMLYRLGLGSAAILAYLTYLAVAFYRMGFELAIWDLAIFIPAIGFVVWMRRSYKRSDETLLKLSEPAVVYHESYEAHRPKLVMELLKRSLLVDRAGCEAMHQRGKMPPHLAGGNRRRQIDLAKRLAVWDEFDDSQRALLSAQEGSWDTTKTLAFLHWVEDVHVLRWVLCIDSVLTPFELLCPDLSPALEITRKPGLTEGVACMAPYDMRAAEGMARTMFNRCLAEGGARGWLEIKPGARESVLNFVKSASGESTDLLISGETVARSTLEHVQRVAQASHRRIVVLGGVIRYLNGPHEEQLSLTTSM